METRDADLIRFCEREFPRLVAAIGLICGDVYVAEDLAQEALARAYERWDRVRVLESPGGWVHRVGVNLAKSHLRRRGAERRALGRVASEGRPAAHSVERPDVLDLVAALPRRERVAVVAAFYLGMSGREVAELLGTTQGAARNLIYRGVARLRASLEQDLEAQHE